MPDPIKDLEEFPTMPTTPLPAGEVRRRGDQMRRRRTFLASVASAAAVAVIATGGYAATQFGRDGDTGSQIAHQPTANGELYGPLTLDNLMTDADTVLPNGDSWPAGSRSEGEGHSAANVCQPEDSGFAGLSGATDVVSSQWYAEALFLSQVAVQFSDTATAKEAATTVEGWLTECTPGELSADYRARAPQRLQVADGVVGELVTSTWTYTGETGGEGYADRLMVTAVLRTGNRISVLTHELPASQKDPEAPIRAMLAAAAARLTSEAPEHSPPAPGGIEVLPDSIDITAGFPRTTGSGSPVKVTGNTDVDGLVPFDLCRQPAWDPGTAIDRRAVTYTGEGEDSRVRTLTLYADEADAEAAVTRIREAVAACAEESADDGGITTLVHAPTDVALGDSSFGFTTRYRVRNQGFSQALSVYEFVRVDSMVLAAMDGGDGGNQVEQFVGQLEQSTTPIIDQMRAALAPASVALTTAGYGPLVLGKPAPTRGAELVEGRLVDQGCGQVVWELPAGERVTTAVSADLGVAVIFLGSEQRTPEGIGLGSTREELLAAYPDATYSKEHNAYLVTPEGQPDRHWEFFLDLDDAVTEADLQLNNQDCVG